MTLGAGVQWYEAYAAAEAQGRVLVGGLSEGGSVGAAGGWIMGGGHSAFSSTFGLGMSPQITRHQEITHRPTGVDNVLEFTVVTANGDNLTVNSYENPDLFWALRGGGGGTYAVVTSVTYLTHDLFSLSVVFFSANFTTPSISQTVTSEWVKIHPSLADQQWGGYSFLSPEGLQFFYGVPNVSLADANLTINPFVASARSQIPDLEVEIGRAHV